jgi:1,4-alpha-glucan branching enzyme
MTFGMVYAYSERFILPISHDEVVHGKGSMLAKMPGDHWQKLANLRCYLGFMWAHPGKKLLFMGCEIAQDTEWSHDDSLHWDLLDRDQHAGIQHLIRRVNEIYAEEPALQAGDFDPQGFQWAAVDDENAVLGMVLGKTGASSMILAVSNFTPVPRERYRVGVPREGQWIEVLNTDSTEFGGSGIKNGVVASDRQSADGQPDSIELSLPPLATLYLKFGQKI